MSTLIWYGDVDEELTAREGKKQVLIARNDYTEYVIYGDSGAIYNGSRGGNDIIMGKVPGANY